MLGAAPSVGMDDGVASTRRALFVAPDAAAVARLWASDGTPAGTGTIELPGPVADLGTVRAADSTCPCPDHDPWR